MPSRRPAGSRKGATTPNPRRNPSRNAVNPLSSIPTQMRVTKSQGRGESTKDIHELRSNARSTPRTRTQARPQYRESSEDESPTEEDDEDFEELSQAAPQTTRKSARAAISRAASDTQQLRISRAAASANKDSTSKPGKGTTSQIPKNPSKKRGRPSKSTSSTTVADMSSDEAEEDDSGDDIAVKISPNKSPNVKTGRSRGRPPRKKVKSGISKLENLVIPNWLDPRMEHAIWVQVFRYAAVTGDEHDILDSNWLVRTAGVCRVFTDPALTVLYRRPPIKDEAKAQGLVGLLEKSPSMTAVNYRAKIEELHIDVRLVSLQGFTSPVKLMQNLPRLSEVLLLHGYDQSPYRLLREPIKWTYSAELWQAFDVSPTADEEAGDKTSITRLHSWQWSSRLMDKNWEASLARMKQVHQMPSFVSLRKLKLVNYQLPSVRLEKDPGADPELLAEDEQSVRLIASALSTLENLEQLVFESSTIMCTMLFPLLPPNLKRLELVNCAEVTADNLGSFLITNGHQMEALVLNHNRSLNLAFLTMLGAACPHLKELRANFKYFSLLETVDDNDPFYDHLLLPEQVPNWPSALEVVHLENLRQWDMAAAEMLLQSFIDSASVLPMLRHLSIKAMLDIPWRSRSDFRKSWQEKFEKVFLRPVTDPEPNFTLRKQAISEPAQEATVKHKPRKVPVEPTRRSSRVVPHASRPSSRASSTLRELRDQHRKPQSYREPDSDEFDSGDDVGLDENLGDVAGSGSDQNTEESSEDLAASDDMFIQGLCTVVDINIDNQKPREHQYSMDDFLNDEGDFETDDEWDGDLDFE
ncbi:uncharacterized protein CTRU02_203429 [Colletotrichum truncatum]|uniref:Uncharacterized protein n=1 Tax=Colletotrichum truncatum TaxID=5467 RepID=A0ACC3Z9A2_COLTU|nr:uncharacterized protein CTRU02_05811 [Colletotrichum truncatum]KAF6793556.1 hypothetical protein CTRU02_05811 [Colletotrichum truncatum]